MIYTSLWDLHFHLHWYSFNFTSHKEFNSLRNKKIKEALSSWLCILHFLQVLNNLYNKSQIQFWSSPSHQLPLLLKLFHSLKEMFCSRGLQENQIWIRDQQNTLSRDLKTNEKSFKRILQIKNAWAYASVEVSTCSKNQNLLKSYWSLQQRKLSQSSLYFHTKDQVILHQVRLYQFEKATNLALQSYLKLYL